MKFPHRHGRDVTSSELPASVSYARRQLWLKQTIRLSCIAVDSARHWAHASSYPCSQYDLRSRLGTGRLHSGNPK